MDDCDDTKSLLQAFPFLCDDESSSTEQPSSSQPSKEQFFSSQPLIQDAIIDDVDIFIDLPIDCEHGSCHVYDEDFDANVFSTSEDPATYSDAICSPQKDQWQEAMEAEYDSVISKGTWILTEMPSGRTAIKCK